MLLRRGGKVFLHLLFLIILGVESIIEIHNHHHTHEYDPSFPSRGSRSEDQSKVPSAGDGALNPWLYRFPPWFEPHNPPPPSLELTNGEAAKSHISSDHSTPLRTVFPRGNIADYDEFAVINSHPYSDEVAKTVVNSRSHKKPDHHLLPSTLVTTPELETGFYLSNQFPFASIVNHRFNNVDDDELVLYVKDGFGHSFRSFPNRNPKYIGLPNADNNEGPWLAHKKQKIHKYTPLSENVISEPELPVMPLDGPFFDYSPSYNNHKANGANKGQLELLNGFYPSKEPFYFSNFKPNLSINRATSGRSQSVSVAGNISSTVHPKSIQEIIRRQHKEIRENPKAVPVDFSKINRKEESEDKWVWPSR